LQDGATLPRRPRPVHGAIVTGTIAPALRPGRKTPAAPPPWRGRRWSAPFAAHPRTTRRGRRDPRPGNRR